jgi:uracil-DNA glycosylase family 4
LVSDALLDVYVNKSTVFDPACRLCPRLASFLAEVKNEYPDYHARPVPPFGDPDPDLLIVGLAPGMHGANATGRPFTGDFAGILLYNTLFQYGFSNQNTSVSSTDGLRLKRCRITNAVKCLPPRNKPATSEITMCNHFLRNEILGLKPGAMILALGNIAHNAVLKAMKMKMQPYKFAHGAEHPLPEGRILIDSYHCSRYNTQTRRLTEEMFTAVFERIRARIEAD